ncbi:unnamed protein product [Urochloa decumbens]|uniref:Uncharacterized protein n=1 Tax=Urochloa decumbens TaxID=240449 RepID=A0ABC9B1H3_9POAL
MDVALKNIFRLFMEGIMIMVCPVLLAMVVNQKTEGHELVNGITSSVAALTLEAGILPFVVLSVLPGPGCAARYLYGASKWFLHLSALLLVVLAVILLLIISMSMDKPVYMFVLMAFLAVVLTTWWCMLSVQNSPGIDSTTYNGHEAMLENLTDFSAAVTSILFLGLEWLALGGQSSGYTAAAHGLDRRLLAASLGVGFFTCVLGVSVMLQGTVPSVTSDGNKGTANVEAANIVLAIFTGATVILITSAAVKEMGWCVIAPALVAFLTWAYLKIFDGAAGREEEVAKPASLALTKVTFTGFFAVSVLSIGNSSLSTCTKAFIMLTSAAVISGIGWRLLTHRTSSSRAVIVAANTASLCAHVCVALVVFPFVAMAVNGLK